ncbi:AlbA family DNA-binding domain-containing protein [Aureibacter tunicatorum]|uniref:HTH transcriptional regulator n=1 Tax=Aureibacter tunicatorum TaxID=866807 RepID=A0AAE3XQM4_9BACT|nr:ATP-binding protein [Aureibacter tunicatorum]MDR6240136.1 putative HTH transcriptional regulator [Aureibacter tunicatorum]BDD05983.1 hypothetical protein AUTU_34660 [Aureibacter tunicatorum]
MDYATLQHHVQYGEGQHTEFKRKVNHPEKIIKEIVAFANSGGGRLFLGVDDNGDIHGLKYADGDIFELNKFIQTMIKPAVKYKLEKVHVGAGKEVVCYEIEQGHRKPYIVREKPLSKIGTAYIRSEDKSIQASKEVREILRRQRRGLNIQFHFGETEKLLMEYLEAHGKITVSIFRKIAKLSKYLASKKLILLTLANVLEIIPSDREDEFVMREMFGY